MQTGARGNAEYESKTMSTPTPIRIVVENYISHSFEPPYVGITDDIARQIYLRGKRIAADVQKVAALAQPGDDGMAEHSRTLAGFCQQRRLIAALRADLVAEQKAHGLEKANSEQVWDQKRKLIDELHAERADTKALALALCECHKTLGDAMYIGENWSDLVHPVDRLVARCKSNQVSVEAALDKHAKGKK